MEEDYEYPKVLVLGDGLLGSEIIKQSGWEYLSMDKDGIDVLDDFSLIAAMIDDIFPDVVLNCIGWTDTYSDEKFLHWNVNYKFVVNLVDFCDSRDIKIAHMSSDYIFANSAGYPAEDSIPVNQETWYAYTKLISDAYVQLANSYLLFRGGLKPKPFPYEKAFDNVYGTFDYVDIIAKQIIELIREDREGIWNIGSERKTMYDLAKQTRPDVGKIEGYLPSVVLDLTKFQTKDSKP